MSQNDDREARDENDLPSVPLPAENLESDGRRLRLFAPTRRTEVQLGQLDGNFPGKKDDEQLDNLLRGLSEEPADAKVRQGLGIRTKGTVHVASGLDQNFATKQTFAVRGENGVALMAGANDPNYWSTVLSSIDAGVAGISGIMTTAQMLRGWSSTSVGMNMLSLISAGAAGAGSIAGSLSAAGKVPGAALMGKAGTVVASPSFTGVFGVLATSIFSAGTTMVASGLGTDVVSALGPIAVRAFAAPVDVSGRGVNLTSEGSNPLQVGSVSGATVVTGNDIRVGMGSNADTTKDAETVHVEATNYVAITTSAAAVTVRNSNALLTGADAAIAGQQTAAVVGPAYALKTRGEMLWIGRTENNPMYSSDGRDAGRAAASTEANKRRGFLRPPKVKLLADGRKAAENTAVGERETFGNPFLRDAAEHILLENDSITLRVGDSSIVIGPNQITIDTPRLEIRGDELDAELGAEAAVSGGEGSLVLNHRGGTLQ